jgi:hypothetical protein
MAEWIGDERAQTLTIGHVRADVWMYGGCTVRSTVEPRGCKNLDAAKTAAEQALREMHDALSQHFASMLRWSRDACPTARVDNWSASTDGRVWMIWHPSVNGPVMIERGPCETIDGGKRAAEAALRSLGVVFRTEGER